MLRGPFLRMAANLSFVMSVITVANLPQHEARDIASSEQVAVENRVSPHGVLPVVHDPDYVEIVARQGLASRPREHRLLGGQRPFKLFPRLRTAAMETLDEVAAECLEPVELVRGLDALGDGRQVHVVSEGDYSCGDGGVV